MWRQVCCRLAPALGRSTAPAGAAVATGRMAPVVARVAGATFRPVRSSAARCLSGTSSADSDDAFKPQRKAVPTGTNDVHDLIDKQVHDNKIMLYMKGTPSAPQCGFSAQVVRILHVQGVNFSSVNVMDHPSIREGIKSFSDWPTIPQVFVDGEFVGGCDVMTQLQESGELETMLKEAGARD